MFSNITLTLVGTTRCCTTFGICLGGRGRKWMFHFHRNILSVGCFTISILRSWSCWHNCLPLCFLLLVYIIFLPSLHHDFLLFKKRIRSLQKGTILVCNLETKDNLQVLELPCSELIRSKHTYFAWNPHPSREKRQHQLHYWQAIPCAYTSSRFTHSISEDK